MLLSIQLYWWVWAAILLVSMAPLLFRGSMREVFRAGFRSISWGLCPIFVALVINMTSEDILGLGSPFASNYFEYNSPFTGYGLAVTLGLSFGTLGSYFKPLDFFFSAGRPLEVREGDVARISQATKHINGQE